MSNSALFLFCSVGVLALAARASPALKIDRAWFWLSANTAMLMAVLGVVPALLYAAAIAYFYCHAKYLAEHRSAGALWLGLGPAIGLLILSKVQSILTASSMLGLSYFLFRMISVGLDTYRHRRFSANIATFGAYAAYFPTFAAGPLMKLETFEQELRRPYAQWQIDWLHGLFRIALGLGQKFILGALVFRFALPPLLNPETHGSLHITAALYACMAGLYFDFSGYSSIAIGTARLFGMIVPENFDRPFLRTNPLDFWRSWHMTLQVFIRDYFYLPMFGGSRNPLGIYSGLMATMLIFCLWHAFSWNFLIIGIYEGLVLVSYVWLKRNVLSPVRDSRRVPGVWRPVLTFLVCGLPIPLFFISVPEYFRALEKIIMGA